jgi:two-component system, OmpR family, sensor kinase
MKHDGDPDREQSRHERRRERWRLRLMRHQERHRRHEEHLRHYWLTHHLHHPRGIRHYIGAHMHRRIFMWFGASIFLTGAMVSAVAHITGGRGPVRGVAGFFLAAAIVWMLAGKIARRIARPLSELVYVAEEIGAGRLRARATVSPWHGGEIGVLSRAINDMAARIEKQISDQRELLAGVSHEIRTPLARIRVLLEIGRQSGVKPATLDELEREVIEIDTLVGELLASARLDFAALTPRPLDGAEVARRALERAGVDCALLSVASDAAALGFEGDATLVARALANLLDNARRHGGGVTALRIAARDGVVSFDVEDGGPGFPADDKSTRRAEGSLGLGLVLVRRIADAHHGSLTLANRAEGGARATIAFPCPLAAGA